ncbi:MAG: adenosine deaminase [Spirochaetales bacterium]|uniref:adenosine deaminase n=1 Tax=Candidatus Thalassospirochaeta sargassi TaxID=3119039 RepID=A0AAJ1IFJ1_9SPIO|nr:adenosine deaminase [Spirochaetales bacterium]
MVTKEMIKKLPKVELHHHLDGGVRPATIVELAEMNNIEIPEHNPAKLAEWLHRGADRKSLALYLEGFAVTCSVMQTTDALTRIARETLEDLALQNVKYAEIRFAPILHAETGLNLEEIVKAVLTGMEEGKQDFDIDYGVILCAMRHQPAEVSLEMAELAVSFRDRGVVGFDIAGDEHGHPPKRHLDAFQHIRNKNFNITIHAGEAFGVESIWQALQICGTHRIGHATRLLEDMVVHGTRIEKLGSLADFIRDKRIPLEMCLSSNIQTGAAPTLDEHPFHVYYRNGFRVMLCTDNPLMSDTDLVKEMSLAAEYYNFTIRDFEKITLNAMKSAFAHYDERLRIIYDVLKPGYAKIRQETNPTE